jgi:hypothetical protein
VASANKTRDTLHLPDGPEQIRRDEAIGKASRGECKSPDLWGDKSFQAWIWGVDIQQQAVNSFEHLYRLVVCLNLFIALFCANCAHRQRQRRKFILKSEEVICRKGTFRVCCMYGRYGSSLVCKILFIFITGHDVTNDSGSSEGDAEL